MYFSADSKITDRAALLDGSPLEIKDMICIACVCATMTYFYTGQQGEYPDPPWSGTKPTIRDTNH